MTLRIISGKFKGRGLKTPKTSTTRPTQGMLREAVFNICQNEIEGARFLDLFAGSGAMGIEALSRGASHATLVESNRAALACVKENIKTIQVEQMATLLPISADMALKKLLKQGAIFDIIYVDPPYDLPIKELIDDLETLLAPGGILFIEERHDPKKTHKPHLPSGLHLKNTRRFGIALLTILTK